MIDSEILSNKIGNYLEKELGLDYKRKSIISYGLFAIIQIGISLVLTIALGILTNSLVESLIITFTVVFLRKYTGGAHASTPNRCLFMGIVVTVIPAIIINRIIQYISIYVIICLICIIYTIAYIIVINKAPVDTENKRIKSEEKRKRLKKSSIIILSIYLSISMVMGVLYFIYKDAIYVDYVMSISYGILWQSFTLTKFAAKMISI